MTPTRATRSKDGAYRLDLRVPVRLDLDSMATAVALGSFAAPDEIATAGLRRLLGWARDGVGAHGLDHIFMGDTEGMEDEIEAARSRLVDLGVFPPATTAGGRAEDVPTRR
jgi:hypothetical protein